MWLLTVSGSRVWHNGLQRGWRQWDCFSRRYQNWLCRSVNSFFNQWVYAECGGMDVIRLLRTLVRVKALNVKCWHHGDSWLNCITVLVTNSCWKIKIQFNLIATRPRILDFLYSCNQCPNPVSIKTFRSLRITYQPIFNFSSIFTAQSQHLGSYTCQWFYQAPVVLHSKLAGKYVICATRCYCSTYTYLNACSLHVLDGWWKLCALSEVSVCYQEFHGSQWILFLVQAVIVVPAM